MTSLTPRLDNIEGRTYNGIIVPSVAGNNLTVALKTLEGSNPSTTSPVYVRIGDTIRTVDAPLYVTVTGGIDDWDRTLYTYSLFVYLGWDDANDRVEILLCPQPTYLVYPAANPAAPEPRRLRSAYGANTGTAISSGHTMQVIGRVDGVVQSVADNFTGVTSTALSYPVYFTPVLASPNVPIKSNVGDTTPVFATNQFLYQLNFNLCMMEMNFSGDGGTDGAGSLGPLVIYIPFKASSLVTSPYGGSIAVRGAGWSGTNIDIGVVAGAASTNQLIWQSCKVTSATTLTTILPSHFTNGSRDLTGDYQVLILA